MTELRPKCYIVTRHDYRYKDDEFEVVAWRDTLADARQYVSENPPQEYRDYRIEILNGDGTVGRVDFYYLSDDHQVAVDTAWIASQRVQL